jgi:hypothetical protein
LGFLEGYFASLDSHGKKKSRRGVPWELGYGCCEVHLECYRWQYTAKDVRASPLLSKFERPGKVGFGLALLGRMYGGAFPVWVKSLSKCRLELVRGPKEGIQGESKRLLYVAEINCWALSIKASMERMLVLEDPDGVTQ